MSSKTDDKAPMHNFRRLYSAIQVNFERCSLSADVIGGLLSLKCRRRAERNGLHSVCGRAWEAARTSLNFQRVYVTRRAHSHGTRQTDVSALLMVTPAYYSGRLVTGPACGRPVMQRRGRWVCRSVCPQIEWPPVKSAGPVLLLLELPLFEMTW